MIPIPAVFSIREDVAASSISLVVNPLAYPSICKRNLSPLRKISAATFDIPLTIDSKSLVTCFAIATPFIPNNVLIADDAKTGSSASTIIRSPSFLILRNFWFCILRTFLIFVIRAVSYTHLTAADE